MRFNRSTKRWKLNIAFPAHTHRSAGRGVQQLIQVLREELSEYGSMLVLLDQQQRHIIAHQGEALLKNADSISGQVESLASIRMTRQRLSCDLAEAMGEPNTPTFRKLVALVPSKHQPLLEALVDQINFIIYLCQQRLLQNKLLLGPSLASDSPIQPQSRLVLFGLN